MPWVAANNRHAARLQVMLRVAVPEAEARLAAAPEERRAAVLRDIDVTDPLQAALVHPQSLAEVGAEQLAAWQERGHVLLFVRTHAQFVVKAKFDTAIPLATIVLNQAQRLNCEVTFGPELFPWSIYDEPNQPLATLTLEIRPRFAHSSKHGDADDDEEDDDDLERVQASREALRAAVAKTFWDMVLTANERALLFAEGRQYALRVAAVTIEQDPEAEDDNELFIPDEYRGILATTTKIFIDADASFPGDFELQGAALPRDAKPQANIVDVYCNDEEWFPVKKRLLQPCITLAKHVLSKSTERESIHVNLDCCTFDKVLRYLEAEARGEKFHFELHETEQLLGAAAELRLIGLQRLCEKALGDYHNSIRDEIPWEEVKQRNANGELLIVIDGCVCNITNWLEHHPGGNTIIPEQAVNCDATVLFEVYHASRESFLFLKQLYIGELRVADRHLVPPPKHFTGQNEPSATFLEQLREFVGQIKHFKTF